MKQPDLKVLEQALKLHKSGKKMHEILDVTELNYSQAWLFINDAELDPKQRVKSEKRTAATVRQLRNTGTSWGMISVMFGYKEFPESKIRKMFEEASGLKSQGLRIARGGRFLNRDPELYLDERRRSGIEIPIGTLRSEFATLATGRKATGAAKRTAKATGAVKTAKATKKATAKKIAKKVAPKTEVTEEDPFE